MKPAQQAVQRRLIPNGTQENRFALGLLDDRHAFKPVHTVRFQVALNPDFVQFSFISKSLLWGIHNQTATSQSIKIWAVGELSDSDAVPFAILCP